MCLACWCSHSSRLLALMWFARWVLITPMGSTPVTQKEGSPASTTDRSTSHHQHLRKPVTPYGVILSLWRCNRAPPLGDHPIAKLLSRQPRTPALDIGGRDGQARRRRRGP